MVLGTTVGGYRLIDVLGAGGDVSTFTSLLSVPVCASREAMLYLEGKLSVLRGKCNCTWRETDCTSRERLLYLKGKTVVLQGKKHCTPWERNNGYQSKLQRVDEC
jgi:hypothetical protein